MVVFFEAFRLKNSSNPYLFSESHLHTDKY